MKRKKQRRGAPKKAQPGPATEIAITLATSILSAIDREHAMAARQGKEKAKGKP